MRPIHLCRSEARGSCECARTVTNTADRHIAHRNPRSALSVPREKKLVTNDTEKCRKFWNPRFLRYKKRIFWGRFHFARQHPDPLSLRNRARFLEQNEPSTRPRGRAFSASVERSRQSIPASKDAARTRGLSVLSLRRAFLAVVFSCILACSKSTDSAPRTRDHSRHARAIRKNIRKTYARLSATRREFGSAHRSYIDPGSRYLVRSADRPLNGYVVRNAPL